MKSLVILAVFGVLIVLAVRMTVRQFRLERAEAEAIASPQGSVVGVAGPDGKFLRVTEGLDVMRGTWHPIRFPSGWESRCAGFPEERAYFDRTLSDRRAWCEDNCEGAWRVEVPKGAAPIFWFESHRDATEFSFAWFPFKCS